MAVSEIQLVANRENAAHSTGPRTTEGKQRASLNAMRHGLTSQVVVLAHEDMQAYLALHKETVKEWSPQGIHEQRLVQRLIDTDWRLNRCPSLENSPFALGHGEEAGDIDADNAQIHAALTSARVLRDRAATLESLGRHEARLTRIYHTTLKELRGVQEVRKHLEKTQMSRAAQLYETSKMKRKPYDPAEDGFVLSVGEIQSAIGRDHRWNEAQRASCYNYDLKKFKIANASG